MDEWLDDRFPGPQQLYHQDQSKEGVKKENIFRDGSNIYDLMPGVVGG